MSNVSEVYRTVRRKFGLSMTDNINDGRGTIAFSNQTATAQILSSREVRISPPSKGGRVARRKFGLHEH